MSKEEKILDVVKKLFEKTTENGATEEEALSAITKAHELLAKYNLSVSDIKEETDVLTDLISLGTKTLSMTQWELASALAKHFGVMVFKSSYYGAGSRLSVVGEKKNVDTFRETYLFAYNHFKKTWQRHCAKLDYSTSMKNIIRGSFFKGFVDGLTNELIKAESEKAVIVLRSHKVDEYVKENFNIRTTSVAPIKSFGKIDSYYKGYAEGSYGQRNKHSSIEN